MKKIFVTFQNIYPIYLISQTNIEGFNFIFSYLSKFFKIIVKEK